MKKVKAVIWDLDNTLWDGSVFYKDREGIQIKSGTKATLKELNKRGIKNCICSKNYLEDAQEILEKFDIGTYFDTCQINWGLKSESIKKILQELKLKSDEVYFIDDDAFQIAEVKSRIPEIMTATLQDPLDVLDFEGISVENGTEIDKNRVKILKQQRDRDLAEKSFKGDFKDFLNECTIKLIIRDIQEKDWERVVQLLNRTNELNATLNRYTFEDLRLSYKYNGDRIIVAELEDKFGDYGLIAETIIEIKDYGWWIKDLAVSCRTMGRGIGSALLIFILKQAKKESVPIVRGFVNSGESNWRMKPLYEKRGFKKEYESETTTSYMFDLSWDILPYPSFIEIIDMRLKNKKGATDHSAEKARLGHNIKALKENISVENDKIG